MRKLIFILIAFAVILVFAKREGLDKSIGLNLGSLLNFLEDKTYPTFQKITGKVTFRQKDISQNIKEGLVIENGGTLETDEDSYAVINFGKKLSSSIKIGPDSILDLQQVENKITINLKKGTLLISITDLNDQKFLDIQTSLASMEIKANIFIIRSETDSTLVLVKEGLIKLKNKTTKKSLSLNTQTGANITYSSGNIFVEFSKYKVDWNFASSDTKITEEILTLEEKKNSIFIPLLKDSIKKLKEQFEASIATLDAKRSNLAITRTERAEEYVKMQKDNECLENQMRDCTFESAALISNIGNIKDQANRFVYSPSLKNILKADMDKYKVDLDAKIRTIESEVTDAEINRTNLEKKNTLAQTKYEQLKSLNEPIITMEDKVILKEIVDTLEINELKAEFEKLDN